MEDKDRVEKRLTPPNSDDNRHGSQPIRSIPYKSILEGWHDRAAVRSRPRRLLGVQLENASLVCFPKDLSPIIGHRLLDGSHPAIIREALMQQLFSYLNFTDRLEHEVVNNTVRSLACGMSGLTIPLAARLDAHKIYCDEAYHSLFSADLMFQIENQTGFQYNGGEGHPALSSFYSEVETFEPEAKNWIKLFLVVVSETLISGSLIRIPESKDVIPAVREMVADHAMDEVRHHAFFTHLSRIAWPQVPEHVQIRIGCALPRFIKAFLTPDYPSLRTFLQKRFGKLQTETILHESYPPDFLLKEAQSASRATLRAFQEAGAFELPQVVETLLQEGFVLPSRSTAV
jgi:hypothetical protein